MQKIALTAFILSLLSFTTPVANSESRLSSVPSEVNALSTTGEEVNNTAVTFEKKQIAFDAHVKGIYDAAGLGKKGLAFEVFRKTVAGFQNLKQKDLISSTKSVVSVIDFTKPSSQKRLWIVDLDSRKLLFNSLVAHGKNTGQDKAVNFSNTPNSNMSSMGFYVTDRTYFGKHGLSLRLSGVDDKFNSNAMSRAIVVHGADYVSESFVKQYGRLGRSLGCPAVPQELSKAIINNIKDNTTLYIHTADKAYTSRFLDEVGAVEGFALEMPELLSTTSI